MSTKKISPEEQELFKSYLVEIPYPLKPA